MHVYLEKGNEMKGTFGMPTGMPIIFSEFACDPKYETVKRTWKERLFSKPWQPKVKYKRVMIELNPLMYKIHTSSGYSIIAHPTMKEQICNLDNIA